MNTTSPKDARKPPLSSQITQCTSLSKDLSIQPIFRRVGGIGGCRNVFHVYLAMFMSGRRNMQRAPDSKPVPIMLSAVNHKRLGVHRTPVSKQSQQQTS